MRTYIFTNADTGEIMHELICKDNENVMLRIIGCAQKYNFVIVTFESVTLYKTIVYVR